MNIFEKIQTVRVQLSADNLKKGKKNEYAGYTYYELGDFLHCAVSRKSFP